MAETFNPQMLALAREARGKSQGQLAAELGVSQGKISKLESGMLGAGAGEVERIAAALDFPPGFFYQTDEVRAAGSGCLYHRKRASMPIGELRVIQAMVNIGRMHVSRLLQAAEVATDISFFLHDVDDCEGGPTEIARKARAVWGLPPGPIPHLIRAVESAGGIVVPFDFGTRKLDAIAHRAPGVPPLFFLNKVCPVDRLRFSLAHEIGHFIMHRVPGENAEAEADTFAAEFLMPEADIQRQLDRMTVSKAATLKPYWRASMAALIKRAADLGAITPSTYRRLFTDLSKLGYRTSEPVELSPEEPTVLRDLIRFHLEDCGYTTRELGRVLHCSERDLFDRYLPERPRLRIVE